MEEIRSILNDARVDNQYLYGWVARPEAVNEYRDQEDGPVD